MGFFYWGESSPSNPANKNTTVEVFADAVDGMPDVGQGAGWSSWSWSRAAKELVSVDELVSTNRGGFLSPDRVRKYANGGGGEPLVVETGGRYYIADGHHRAAAAKGRGEKTIRARVKHV